MNAWSLAALRPGLWTAAVALVLLWALRRWWEAPPWRVTVVLAAVVAAVLGPMLFAGALMPPLGMVMRFPPWRGMPGLEATAPFNPLQHDLVMQILPGQAAVRAVTAAGEWPLWNPWLAAGQPLLADPLSQAFQPLVLAARWLPLGEALTATAALTLFLALVGTWLLLHRLGLGSLAATAGSLGWGLGGWMLHWLGWHQATVGALLPWLLYAIALSAERQARRDFVLLGGVTLTLLLAGHPETIVYALLSGAAFGVARAIPWRALGWRVIRRREPPTPGRRAVRVLARQAAAGAVALALAAPALLPFLDYLPQMVRYQRIEAMRPAQVAAGPWRGWRTPAERRASLEGAGARLAAVAAPGAFGAYWAGGYWGPSNPNEDATGFAGSALLLAALLALWPAWRRLPGERFALGLGLLGIAVLARPPGLLPLLEALPGLGHSPTQHHRVLMLVGFATAWLGAAVIERWRRGDGPPRPVVAGAALLTGAAVTAIYLVHPNPQATAASWALPTGPRLAWWLAALAAMAVTAAVLSVRPGRRATVDASPGAGSGTSIDREGHPPAAGALLARTAGAKGSGGPTGRSFVARRLALTAPVAVPTAILLAVAGELLLLHLPLHPPAPRRLFYPPTEVGRFLAAHLPAVAETVADSTAAGDENVAGAKPKHFGRFTGIGPTYPANTAVLAGLMDIRSSGPAQPAAFSRITERLKARGKEWGDVLARGDTPVLDLLAVRYVATWPDAPLPPPARQVLETPNLRLFERPTALPLVFLPVSAETFRGGSWLDWIDTHGHYAAHSLVQANPGGLPRWRAGAPTGSRVESVTLRPARLTVDLALAEPRLLASSLYQDDQWHLLADGEPVAPVLVNGPFVGAWLPAGTRRVEILYRPRGFLAGCLIAALGLALMIALTIVPSQRPAGTRSY